MKCKYLEDITIIKTSTARFYLPEVSKGVTLVGTESGMVAARD